MSAHIDDFIEDMGSDAYAAWVFNHFRLPALLRIRFDRFMKEHRLFCTYEGKRWRVTGASRMGDVWLSADFAREVGYERRVDVSLCSAWGASP